MEMSEDARAERLPDTSTLTSDPWWADPDARIVDRPLHLTSVLIGWDDLDDLDFEGVENELLNRFALRAWAGGIEVHEEIMDITEAGVRLRLERGDSHQDVAMYLNEQLIAQIPLTPCAA